MATIDDIKSEIGGILRTNWALRQGQTVPEPEDVQLGNDAVKLDATVLYADLAESTKLVKSYKDTFAAEIYKCFLRGACRVILSNGGTVTAFDGDRVMAVYLGTNRNTQAVGSALQLNHVVSKVLNPAIREVYAKSTFEVRYAAGIDTSPLLVARTGVRGSNDLVWVGRAANYAAKMATFRDGAYVSWITADVYAAMHESYRHPKAETPTSPTWSKRAWKEREIDVYASTWEQSL
jgi:class 3 adenylate cyclase